MAHQAARTLNILPPTHALRQFRACLAVGAFAIRGRFIHEANLEVFAYVGGVEWKKSSMINHLDWCQSTRSQMINTNRFAVVTADWACEWVVMRLNRWSNHPPRPSPIDVGWPRDHSFSAIARDWEKRNINHFDKVRNHAGMPPFLNFQIIF